MVHQQFSVFFFFKVENISKGVSIYRGRVPRCRGMYQNLSVRVSLTPSLVYMSLFFFLNWFNVTGSWETKDLKKQLEWLHSTGALGRRGVAWPIALGSVRRYHVPCRLGSPAECLAECYGFKTLKSETRMRFVRKAFFFKGKSSFWKALDFGVTRARLETTPPSERQPACPFSDNCCSIEVQMQAD